MGGSKILELNPTQPILTQLVRILNPLLNIVTINVIIKAIITFKPITIRLGGGLGTKTQPGVPAPKPAPNPLDPNPTQQPYLGGLRPLVGLLNPAKL